MRDVARAAGVSVQTVSNFVNGRFAEMSPDTRGRVEQAMAQLDYHPAASAQGLRSARTRTLGFFVLDVHQAFLADPLTSLMLAGVGDVAHERQFDILVQGTAREEPQLRAPFQRRRVDGAFVLLTGAPERRAAQIDSLLEIGAEFVVFDEVISDERVLSVRAAERDGGRMLTEHLIELGHRRIAFVGPKVPWAVVEQRFLGYRDALAISGIDPAPALELFEAEGYGPAAGADMIGRLLALPTRPTAVICSSDLIALAALAAAREAGLAVPDDIAVAGFDDFDFSALISPALTTVAVPGYEMGRAAATMLIGRLERQPIATPHAIFAVQLRRREST